MLVYLVIVAAILTIWFANPGAGANVKQLTISELVQAVKAGLIAEGDGIMEPEPSYGRDGYVISGEMTNPAVAAPVEGVEPAADLPAKLQFSARGRLTEDDFLLVREVLTEKRATTGFQDVLISFLPFLLIIGLLYFLFVRQLKSAGKGAMSFGKSKAKMLTREKGSINFKDVAGCDEAKEEVSEVVDFLKDPKKFQRIGGRIPKGVLMVGPPGTGKTLLAKAVAGEAEVPFFSISGSDFVEMFVGVGASRVRDMFEQAKKAAPCIIFIDEIDAVGRQRGAGLGGGHDEREQTLNQMLVEMDGFEGHEGIIVIAATNRPDVLDPALLRPGRFDRQVVVGLPDIRGREQILKVHIRKVPVADNVEPSVIARGTPGFSGADLANLVNEAALFAARGNKRLVSMEEFEKAKDKIMMGSERKSMVMSEPEKEMTAYHEAGHAIVGRLVPEHDPVYKVSIIPRGRALGVTMYLPEQDRVSHSKQHLESMISSLFGGRIAEAIIYGDDKVTTGASNDIERATEIARKMVTQWGLSSKMGPMLYAEDEGEVFLGKSMSKATNMSDDTARAIDAEIKSLIDRNYERAQKILEDNIDILHSMKDALMKYETIDAKQIDDLMNRTDVRPPADWDDSKPSGGDKPSGGAPVREGEIKNDGVDKPSVGKPGDIPS
ncbi:MAG TPA: ATP-dependent metalloprotease [Alteromonas macleodii]|nr:ATP-dependent metalloprotease [Alteromonas macleodii]